MKKSLIFVGILAIGFANAQEGNVGINTDQPKATLDIQPNATNLAGTTNQGILAPRLSKTRVANIETPVQGTLVYVLDENSTEYPNSLISAYTGTDAKVAKITEKGYYFYNGTEWVKAGDNEGLWKYSHDDELTTVNGTTKYKFYSFLPSIFNDKTSMIINTGEGTPNNPLFPKSYGASLELRRYTDEGTLIGSSSLGIEGVELYRDPVGNISPTTMGYMDFKSEPLIDYHTRIRAINHLVDTDTSNDDRNKAFRLESKDDVNGNTFTLDIDGRETKFSNSNYIYSFGKSGALLNAQKAVTSNNIGNYIYHRWLTRTGENNTGNRSFIDWSIKRFLETANGDWKGTTNRLQKSIDETKMGFIDFGIVNDTPNDILTNNGLGFGYNDAVHAVIRENGNMGIGTTKPTEKLEVAGKIKASSLAQTGAGDRVVYADENGVLKTGVSAAANVKLATANNIECTEANTGTMNFGSVTINGKATEAFGFCMKNSTGEYKWYYIYGGAGITTGSGAFGSNL